MSRNCRVEVILSLCVGEVSDFLHLPCGWLVFLFLFACLFFISISVITSSNDICFMLHVLWLKKS